MEPSSNYDATSTLYEPADGDFESRMLEAHKKPRGTASDSQVDGTSAVSSRVLHVRNVAPSTTEEDLAKLVSPFGRAETIKILSQKNQAFIQMESLEAAEKAVAYHKEFGPLVRKRRVFMQFSNYSELSDTHHKKKSLFPPNRILLLTASHMRVSASELATILSQFGPVERVLVPSNSSRSQAFVQFFELEAACEARQQISNGLVLLGGDNPANAHFSKMTELVPKGEADFVDFSTTSDRPMEAGAVKDHDLGAGQVPSLWLDQLDGSDRPSPMATTMANAAASLGAASLEDPVFHQRQHQHHQLLGSPIITSNTTGSGFSRAVGARRTLVPSSSSTSSSSSSSAGGVVATALLGGGSDGLAAACSFLEAQGSPHWGGIRATPSTSSIYQCPSSSLMAGMDGFDRPLQQQQQPPPPGPTHEMLFSSSSVVDGVGSPAAAAAFTSTSPQWEGFPLEDGDDDDAVVAVSVKVPAAAAAGAARRYASPSGRNGSEEDEEGEEEAREAAGAGRRDRRGGGAAAWAGERKKGRGGASSRHEQQQQQQQGGSSDKGLVLLVTGLDPVNTTCDVIYALFSNYGDVVRCKRLVYKPDHALVEMNDAFAAANAVNLLRGCTLFGRSIKVSYSKHSHIFSRSALREGAETTATTITPTDGQISNSSHSSSSSSTISNSNDPSGEATEAATSMLSSSAAAAATSGGDSDDPYYKEYQTVVRKRHIFKHLRSVSGPSSVLYVSHLPRHVTADVVRDHMNRYGETKNVKVFESSGRMQALVEFVDVNVASTALVLSHGSRIERSTIRVAFSKNRFTAPQQQTTA